MKKRSGKKKQSSNRTGMTQGKRKAPGSTQSHEKQGSSGKRQSPGKNGNTGKKRFSGKKKSGRKYSILEGKQVPALAVLVPLIIVGLIFLFLNDVQHRRNVEEIGRESEKKNGESDTAHKEDDIADKEGDTAHKKDDTAGATESGKTESGETAEKSGEASEGESTTPATLYLVIDDVGYDTHNLDMYLSLPVPITYAVLPKLPKTAVSVEKIEDAGRQYILHQPMEPVGKQNPGPGALYAKMKQKEVRRIVAENLKEMPSARGVNNHMGSKATADSEVMKGVLEEVQNKGMFFLDSRTTAKTVTSRIAEEKRVAFTERNVFLDNEDSEQYVRTALEKAKRVADEEGSAVLIGHVWSDALYRVLSDVSGKLEEEGYRFAYLSERFEGEIVHAGTGN